MRIGRCLVRLGITYWPVREILQAQLGLPDDADAAIVMDRLGDRAILGVALGLDVAGGLHLAARDRLRDAWVGLLDEAVAEHPLVLVVEDVHWAEPPLLELLERTVKDVRGRCSSSRRLDRTSRGAARRNVTALELQPLARDDALRLVAELPESVHSFLLDRAEGNPFFVEELTSR